ncbi:MAG TPA: hypothetical protein VGR59_08110 [Gemmatimonadaceae bacterium]|nr:hypothetical protein [Gemmatimonadaceae bacterium]
MPVFSCTALLALPAALSALAKKERCFLAVSAAAAALSDAIDPFETVVESCAVESALCFPFLNNPNWALALEETVDSIAIANPATIVR